VEFRSPPGFGAITGSSEHVDELGEPVKGVGDAFLGDQLTVAVDDGDVVMGFGPIDAAKTVSRLISSNRGVDTCARVYPRRMRNPLLTRLDGLPSDELFAIPATRTASVYVESSQAREN
jgi:hypothetical protein